jgi:2',3'-cyclic-nucleotide 2'-phosphodiesterase/3'-nucleotidase
MLPRYLYIRENNDKVILLDSGGSVAGSLAAHYYAIVAPYKIIG